MSELRFKRTITPLDVAEALAERGVRPQDVAVEDDGEIITIRIKNITLNDTDKATIAQLMRLPRKI